MDDDWCGKGGSISLKLCNCTDMIVLFGLSHGNETHDNVLFFEMKYKLLISQM